MTDEPLHYLPLVELSDRYRQRVLSPVEVTRAMLERIARLDPSLRCYITLLADRAMDRARQAEDEIGRGLRRGPLHGVPIAVKDLCDTSYAPTTAGMNIHADRRPARNATVVDRLEGAGAVVLGKLAMTEGAFLGHHPALPEPVNPWNSQHWTGASSSGSGAATAAGLCFASLGSDTGGSIRFPSSYCGLTGIKPTWGRVSRHGVFPLAESLDHIGPMARNAADAAVMLAVIAGRDPLDPTCLTAPVPDYLATISAGIDGMRLGVDEKFLFDGTDEQVRTVVEDAIEVLLGLGARRASVAFPSLAGLVDAWMSITMAEAAAAHADTFPAQAAGYGRQMQDLLAAAGSISARQLVESQHRRRSFAGEVGALFDDIDLLIVPVSGDTAPLAASVTTLDSVDPEMVARYAAPFDLTGHPTITIQGGFDRAGVPIGFQLVARHLGEALLFRAAHAFQQRTDWHVRHPLP